MSFRKNCECFKEHRLYHVVGMECPCGVFSYTTYLCVCGKYAIKLGPCSECGRFVTTRMPLFRPARRIDE